VSRLEKFPTRIRISPETTLSPLLNADPAGAGTTNFPGAGNQNYRGFRISASGRLAEVGTNNNFLTIHATRDTNTPPANYFTLRVNPITARLNEYRP
jgi:hypothetical protein